MKAYEISYSKPGSSGHRKVVLAANDKHAIERLEAKDTGFKYEFSINSYHKVHKVREVSLDEVSVDKLSVNELLMLMRDRL
jgi:hypothetical protein